VLAVGGAEPAQEAGPGGLVADKGVGDVLGVACGAIDACGLPGDVASVLEVGGHQFSLKCGALALRYRLSWRGRARTQPVRGWRAFGA
jgi:hypothetical protein